MNIYKYLQLERIHRLVYFSNTICQVLKKRFPIRCDLLCEIFDIQNLPNDIVFAHPIGIIIKRNVTFGRNCIIHQNVTIGQKRNEYGKTIIGDNVFIGAGSIILGNLNIGNNVIIGAGAIILKDIPDNNTVVGVWK